jgi:hypothetical protein
MRKLTLSAVSAVLLFGWVGAVRAEETAQDIVLRAVKAHGGEERLSRVRADKVKVKGTFFVADKETPFTGETTVQLPNQFRNLMQLTGDHKVTLLQILNGEKVYVTIDGQPQKVEPTAVAEMRETMQVDRVVRLVPLLTDKAYTLEALGESKIGDDAVLGVKASRKGAKDVVLYFNKDSALLVKTEHSTDDGSGKVVLQEEYYSDFRDVEGYKRPLKIIAYRGGKKIMEAELVEVKYLDKVDESEFAKP